MKTSESVSRTGSIPDVGTGQMIETAYSMPVGQVSDAKQIAGNWIVYRVAAHQGRQPEPNCPRNRTKSSSNCSNRSRAPRSMRSAQRSRTA